MVSPGSVTMRSGVQMCKAWQSKTEDCLEKNILDVWGSAQWDTRSQIKSSAKKGGI